MIELLATSCWIFGQSNLGGSTGLIGRVTKCSLGGIVFYTRENVNGQPSFLVSSGERWGDKIGKTPSAGRQCLELLAPAAQWQEIADHVRQSDGLKRPVFKSKLFNDAFVKSLKFNEVQ